MKREIVLFFILIVGSITLIGCTLALQGVLLTGITSLLVIAIWVAFLNYRADLIHQLKALQAQLLAQEKLASIGTLTAGIIHEIKNPLNFVGNFSKMTIELLGELKELLSKLSPSPEDNAINNLITEIEVNCQKIDEHEQRAESIIKNILLQSRNMHDEKAPCNINNLLDEYYNLSYHGMRAQNSKFNAKIEKHFDPNLPDIMVSSQGIGRVFLNIINNGLYAAFEKLERLGNNKNGFMPTIIITTLQDDSNVIIKIQDNGSGIPESLRAKIFEPFFTTKPTGKGTGLGLSICYDIIVKEHGGQLDILSVPNEFTEFILLLPKNNTQ